MFTVTVFSTEEGVSRDVAVIRWQFECHPGSREWDNVQRWSRVGLAYDLKICNMVTLAPDEERSIHVNRPKNVTFVINKLNYITPKPFKFIIKCSGSRLFAVASCNLSLMEVEFGKAFGIPLRNFKATGELNNIQTNQLEWEIMRE
ncbi:unnamed protein product [Echinostoma caproni]|uniref:Integrin_alpha2 domain-containing protein n=1 Tax=Echinostoma caproni TaxID=27848 RepID=A0A183AQ33_9TREM|nr:unnamed protein product [Echinostoma caproni]